MRLNLLQDELVQPVLAGVGIVDLNSTSDGADLHPWPLRLDEVVVLQVNGELLLRLDINARWLSTRRYGFVNSILFVVGIRILLILVNI